MSRPVFDLNVFVEYKDSINNYHFSKMALSAIVLYELTATTIDKSDWQKFTTWRKLFTKLDRFLIPNSDDWWESQKSPRVSDTAKNHKRKAKPRNIRTLKDCKTTFSSPAPHTRESFLWLLQISKIFVKFKTFSMSKLFPPKNISMLNLKKSIH